MKTALKVIIVSIVIIGLVAAYAFTGFSPRTEEPYTKGPDGPPPLY
ncbi:MAG: hypothetical protein Q8P45_02475 [Candidatus Harrisonbacteria bacterium]|nr:hypothetical protein [Candidatus Harrisonbacteria bacterium]